MSEKKIESRKSNLTRTTERQKALEDVWTNLSEYEREEWLSTLGFLGFYKRKYSRMEWNDLPDEFIFYHIDYSHNLTLDFIREIKETLERSMSPNNEQKITLLNKLEKIIKDEQPGGKIMSKSKIIEVEGFSNPIEFEEYYRKENTIILRFHFKDEKDWKKIWKEDAPYRFSELLCQKGAEHLRIDESYNFEIHQNLVSLKTMENRQVKVKDRYAEFIFEFL